jgi:D-glycero-alpha-D-manno-heptose-7-phosphate kinase
MYSYRGDLVSAEQLAAEACEIEIDLLGKPIGIQDQYIAAFGGLRFIEFLPNDDVICQKLEVHPNTMKQLEANTMLFFTGITRASSGILKEQYANVNQQRAVLRQMRDMAHIARDALLNGNVSVLGELLHESWQLKKQLASRITNGSLDEIYNTARRAGAIGGKISGAGGGGFLLLYCPYERQDDVREALGAFKELPFGIEPDGTKVIFNYKS